MAPEPGGAPKTGKSGTLVSVVLWFMGLEGVVMESAILYVLEATGVLGKVVLLL